MFDIIINFLYNISNLSLFFLINIIVLISTAVFLFCIKKFVPNNYQKEELGSFGNFVAGAVGGLHAISAGFILMYLVGNFNKAEDLVVAEGITLRRFSDTVNWLPPNLKSEIYINTTGYIQEILNHEWPLMEKGEKVDNEALSYLQLIIKKIKDYKDDDSIQLFIKETICNEIKELYTARYKRIQMSYVSLNPQYWVFIFITTAISLIFLCMLGNKLYLHNISVVLVCINSASIIFLLISLNKPFRGALSVKPDALKESIIYMQQSHQ